MGYTEGKERPKILIVEGENDKHVLWSLCKRMSIPKNFDVKLSEHKNKSSAIEAFTAGLKSIDVDVLAICIDADESASNTWDSLRSILHSLGFPVQREIPHRGYIGVNADDKKTGVWIMPNNQTGGELEDFIQQLIPPDDDLRPIAENTLTMIENEGKARYGNDRAKAFIHTWLAWQKEPGKPIGQSITATYLSTDSNECVAFADWLKRVFNDEQ